jgi:hypothetical protein
VLQGGVLVNAAAVAVLIAVTALITGCVGTDRP